MLEMYLRRGTIVDVVLRQTATPSQVSCASKELHQDTTHDVQLYDIYIYINLCKYKYGIKMII